MGVGVSRTKVPLLAAGVLLLSGGLLWAADEAEASHYWAASLEWERTADVGGPAIELTGYLSFDPTFTPGICFTGGALSGRCVPPKVIPCSGVSPNQFIPAASGSWGIPGMLGNIPAYGPAPQPNWMGDLTLTQNGLPKLYIPFGVLVEYVDPLPASAGGHCRYVGKIVDPVTHRPIILPLPDPTEPALIEWLLLARSGAPTQPNHMNNGDSPTGCLDPANGCSVAAYMTSLVDPLTPNSSPSIDLPELSRFTYHFSKGYGNHHCPAQIICRFYIPATDPDGDALSFDLATPFQASYMTGIDERLRPFRQPDAVTVNSATGLVSWNTGSVQNKANAPAGPPIPGEIYSVQIIVSDGKTSVPVDFMIEIEPPPDPCPDGSMPIQDPDTGQYLPCEPPEPCELDPSLPECNPTPIPPKPQGRDPTWNYIPVFPKEPVLVPTVSGAAGSVDVLLDGHRFDLAGGNADDDNWDDEEDTCPGLGAGNHTDADLDGMGNACDGDDDNDGIEDGLDACPVDPDPRCGLPDDELADVEEGQGSRGSLGSGDTLQQSEAKAALAESNAPGNTVVVWMGVLAAAFLLLIVAARRRRDD